MLVVSTPLEAYRSDLENNPGKSTLTPDDATFLLLGAVLQRISQLPAREVVARQELRDKALQLATELSSRAASHGVTFTTVMRRIVDIVEEGGALRFANTLLHLTALADREADPVDAARIVLQRARVARKAGEAEQARVLYEETLALGQKSGNDELIARAYLGHEMLARSRGNFPEVRRLAALAADAAAKSGVREVIGMVEHELMVIAATGKRFDEAMLHAWTSFQNLQGIEGQEVSALVSLGQLLLDSGRARVALRVFGAALSRAPVKRAEIPALGGAVRAASREGMEPMVRRLVARIDALTSGTDLRPESVGALGEAALALRPFAPEESERRRVAAHAEAVRSGFHEIAFQLEHLEAEVPTPPIATPANSDVERVVNEASKLRTLPEYAAV